MASDGETYLLNNQLEAAHEAFKAVYRADPSYRDVAVKVRDLAERLEGLVSSAEEGEDVSLRVVAEEDTDEPKKKDKKSKISYL